MVTPHQWLASRLPKHNPDFPTMHFLVVQSPEHLHTHEPRPRPRWLNIFNRLLPAANPSFDDQIRKVEYWWIEVNEQGVPQREIAFAKGGQAIAAMPLGRNYGFWTDSQVVLDPREYERVNDSDFEHYWSAIASEVTKP